MPQLNADKANLLARIKVLENENAMLIELAENAKLFALLAESVKQPGDTDEVLADLLEKLALLLNFDLVALCRKQDEKYLIGHFYLAEEDLCLQGAALRLPKKAGDYYCAEAARKLLPQLTEPCQQILLVPFETRVFGVGVVLFGIRQPEEGRLPGLRQMLGQAIDILMLQLENRLLLQNYQQANIFLDQQLEDRSLELAESEALFRAVIEQAYEAFFLHDAKGRFLRVNEQACNSLGYSKEELLERSVADIDPQMTPEGFAKFLQSFGGEKYQRIRSYHQRKDGRRFPVEIIVNRVPLGGEDYYLALVQDISELVKVEDLQMQLDLLMDHLPDIVSMLRPDGQVLYLNRAGRDLFKVDDKDAAGLQLNDLMPERYAKRCLRDHIPEAIEKGSWIGENLLISADKQLIPTLQTIVAPRDKSGELAYIFCIERDLRELRRLEEQFVQAQKMEAIGTLVGGIAHDFNNLLAGIMGNLFLLLRQTEDGPQKERLKSVQQMCQSAAGMISQMLIFARKDVVKIEAVKLTSFMQEFSKMYQVLIPENIVFEVGSVSDELMVLTDVSQLQQIMVNLLSNARDALAGRENPTIGVSIEAFDADEKFLERHSHISQQELVRLSVIDNGCGISEELRDKIFDPFFTTKNLGKGTGLGLAMVFGAIRRQGGGIEVDSRPGQGTIVRVYLPRVLELAEDIRETSESDLDYGQGELILLADDDDFVRDTHQEVLVQLGYRVLAVSDGIQALEAFEACSQIAMVILDVVMPNLDGVSAGEQIKKQNPQLPLLYMTGYADRLDSQQALPADAEVLNKPATMTELSQKVSRLLRK